MTSRKSLNSDFTDFLRSLKGSVLFPAIAMLVLFVEFTFPVSDYVSAEAFKRVKIHEEISMFLNSDIVFSLIPLGMVAAGVLVAVKSLYFVMSKKQTNVYLSLPVKRSVMFFNRISAGAICLFLAVLIPFTVTLFINISAFGMSAHLIKTYLYLVSVYTAYGLVGLSIGSFAASVSGNAFEAGLTSAAAALIPVLAVDLFNDMRMSFLKGYMYNLTGKERLYERLFTPYSFAVDLSAEYTPSLWNGTYYSTYFDPIRAVAAPLSRDGVPADKFKIPEALQIDIWFFIPIIVWLAISIIITAAALYLFNRRKAENANSFGHFRVSTGIIASLAYIGVAVILVEFNSEIDSAIGFALLFIAATLTVYFLTQFILKRKIKMTLKSLVGYGALFVLTAVMFITVSTEYFGTYNKLPKTENIKSVAVTVTGGTHSFEQYLTEYGYDRSRNIIKSTDASDIAMVEKVFSAVRADKGDSKDYKTSISFIITRSDGSEMIRDLPIYSESVYYEYLRSVVDSNYYDLLLKKLLLEATDGDELSFDGGNGYPAEYNYNGYYDKDKYYDSYINLPWTYFDGSLLCNNSERFYNGLLGVVEEQKPERDIIKGEELCLALYNDLSQMTFEQLFRNPNRPIGALSSSSAYAIGADKTVKSGRDKNGDYYELEYTWYTDDIFVPDAFVIYIYPEMVNTVKYLNDNGFKTEPAYTGEIREILFTDSPIDFTEAVCAYEAKSYGIENWYWDDNLNFNTTGSFRNCSFAGTEFMDGEVTAAEYVKAVYHDYEHPLVSVKDKAKIEKIYNRSVPTYTVLGDRGRYVYVIYDGGPIVCYYLPEANLEVLK